VPRGLTAQHHRRSQHDTELGGCVSKIKVSNVRGWSPVYTRKNIYVKSHATGPLYGSRRPSADTATKTDPGLRSSPDGYDTIFIRSLLCAASAPRLMPATNAATIAQTITPSFRDEGLSHRSCLLKRSRSRRFIETPITKRAQTASGSPQLLSTIIENLIKRRFREPLHNWTIWCACCWRVCVWCALRIGSFRRLYTR
jgi:hypothetical protein